MDKDLKNLIDFLDDVSRYLHSWLCTKDGKYVPYSIDVVRNIFRTVFANEWFKSGKNALDAIKERINDGTIVIVPVKDSGNVFEKHSDALDKAHIEYRKKFCEKYSYEEN
jgi:hypothetical protein